MPIPYEVKYTTIGKSKKQKRTVIGIICPTVLVQSLGIPKCKFLLEDMGDINVDWKQTSPGFELLMRRKQNEHK